MRHTIAVLVIAFVIAVLIYALAGCTGIQQKVEQPKPLAPSSQPAGKVSVPTNAPVGGAVGVGVTFNKEVGSSTAGAGSTAYTSVNSAWPTVAFGLGAGLLLILWQREKAAHRQTRHSWETGEKAPATNPYRWC